MINSPDESAEQIRILRFISCRKATLGQRLGQKVHNLHALWQKLGHKALNLRALGQQLGHKALNFSTLWEQLGHKAHNLRTLVVQLRHEPHNLQPFWAIWPDSSQLLVILPETLQLLAKSRELSAN